MTMPDLTPTQVRLRLLAAVVAFAAGVVALLVAILLIKGVLA